MKSGQLVIRIVALAALVAVGVAFAMQKPPHEVVAPPTLAPRSPPPFEEGSPAGALHTYLEGDFAGERLERANWTKYSKLVIWPREPKWGSAYVIRSFRVESGKLEAKHATAEATFITLGELDLERFRYTTSPSEQRVPFDLQLGPDGWLIGAPMLRPHVSPEAARAFLQRMTVGYPTLKASIAGSIAAIAKDAQQGRP